MEQGRGLSSLPTTIVAQYLWPYRYAGKGRGLWKSCWAAPPKSVARLYNITEGFWLITMRRPSPSILRKGEGGERERGGGEREGGGG